MIVFPEKLLVIETTLLPINVTLAERQPLCLISALKMWELIYLGYYYQLNKTSS